ncbi:hypothetical protein KXD40_004591 [Peronospora effusa]|uniref:Uncharacterized protein n=1 Tax=Peronospora effusa TaxID=542832 RepID=A0A3M6VUM8_9STRA|nr:hypothetical protein DD238_002621 [Peronospora effusa]RQM16668.1 hypothetical protein DD237_003749 [Peronospora effusa]UIZ28081.1 hypothetical protein KXD40_004591 [Peronospora effusa]
MEWWEFFRKAAMQHLDGAGSKMLSKHLSGVRPYGSAVLHVTDPQPFRGLVSSKTEGGKQM